MLDLGDAAWVEMRVTGLGKTFAPVARELVIVQSRQDRREIASAVVALRGGQTRVLDHHVW